MFFLLRHGRPERNCGRSRLHSYPRNLSPTSVAGSCLVASRRQWKTGRSKPHNGRNSVRLRSAMNANDKRPIHYSEFPETASLWMRILGNARTGRDGAGRGRIADGGRGGCVRGLPRRGRTMAWRTKVGKWLGTAPGWRRKGYDWRMAGTAMAPGWRRKACGWGMAPGGRRQVAEDPSPQSVSSISSVRQAPTRGVAGSRKAEARKTRKPPERRIGGLGRRAGFAGQKRYGGAEVTIHGGQPCASQPVRTFQPFSRQLRSTSSPFLAGARKSRLGSSRSEAGGLRSPLCHYHGFQGSAKAGGKRSDLCNKIPHCRAGLVSDTMSRVRPASQGILRACALGHCDFRSAASVESCVSAAFTNAKRGGREGGGEGTSNAGGEAEASGGGAR